MNSLSKLGQSQEFHHFGDGSLSYSVLIGVVFEFINNVKNENRKS
jgi:hypothetical protein